MDLEWEGWTDSASAEAGSPRIHDGLSMTFPQQKIPPNAAGYSAQAGCLRLYRRAERASGAPQLLPCNGEAAVPMRARRTEVP